MDEFRIQVRFSFCVAFPIGNYIEIVHNRHDKRWSIEPSGTWLSNAKSARLHTCPVRNYARVLAQRSDATAHLRNVAMETGRFLHPRPKWLQGGTSLLIIADITGDKNVLFPTIASAIIKHTHTHTTVKVIIFKRIKYSDNFEHNRSTQNILVRERESIFLST